MTAFLTFFATPIGRTVAEAVGAILLALGLWWAFAAHYTGVGEAKEHAKTVAAQAGWDQCKANNSTLTDALSKQSAAVGELAVAGDKINASAAKASTAAQSAADGASKAAAAILAKPRPSIAATDPCPAEALNAAAMALVRGDK